MALAAREVTASYRERRVLSNVSLDVRAGEIVAVIGPNGAGKSTLVRVLAGTLRPSTGEVTLEGRDLLTLPRREIARKVAVVPQESSVAFGFTVREVVLMGRAPHQSGLLYPSREDLEALESALRACDLSELADRPLSELSGGERRRVVIARALAQEPRVLLLDEPATHLDVRHSVALYELVRRHAAERGVACLCVMHDLNAVERWADRALLLDAGRVARAGPLHEVLVPELLEPVFGVALRVGTDAEDGARYFLPARRRTGSAS
ncbi:MAG TPA: ABC transporter ATP-binding protein [Polyangiaceae bacterium]